MGNPVCKSFRVETSFNTSPQCFEFFLCCLVTSKPLFWRRSRSRANVYLSSLITFSYVLSLSLESIYVFCYNIAFDDIGLKSVQTATGVNVLSLSLTTLLLCLCVVPNVVCFLLAQNPGLVSRLTCTTDYWVTSQKAWLQIVTKFSFPIAAFLTHSLLYCCLITIINAIFFLPSWDSESYSTILEGRASVFTRKRLDNGKTLQSP